MEERLLKVEQELGEIKDVLNRFFLSQKERTVAESEAIGALTKAIMDITDDIQRLKSK